MIVPQVFWVYSVNSSLAENVVMLTKYHSEGRFCSLGRVTMFHYAACSVALQEVPSVCVLLCMNQLVLAATSRGDQLTGCEEHKVWIRQLVLTTFPHCLLQVLWLSG